MQRPDFIILGTFLIISLSAVGCSKKGVRSDANSPDGYRSLETHSETKRRRESENMSDSQDLKKQIPISSESSSHQSTSNALESITVLGRKVKNLNFDFPLSVNSRVEFWVNYFCCTKGRKHFEKYLERSELFIPFIQPILKANQMPEDLVYLAMIESGFNNHARSSAKAVGPWQFISATGKRYGLKVNWWSDERRDTQKSTLAAVEYLRDLYEMFGSWELAAAGYNAGEAKVARGIRRYGTRDFWQLARHAFLRPETRDYVPKIIAAALIAKNREAFDFPKSQVDTRPDEVIAADGEIVKVVEDANPKANDSEEFSKESRAEIEKILSEDELVAQFESGETPEKKVQATAPDHSAMKARPVSVPHLSKQGQLSGTELMEFEVQSPADLLQIARAAGLSYPTVKSLNPDVLRWCTPPQVSTFRIRLPAAVKNRFLKAYNDSDFIRRAQFLTYKVKKNESLASIARRLGLRTEPLTDLNGVGANTALRNGTNVILPLPLDRSRTLGSLDVLDPPEKSRRSKSKRRGGRAKRA